MPIASIFRSGFWRVWWLSLAAKLALAAWLPMSSDEAYYWVWGRFPGWGYFDHPPMVGWLFSLGRAFDSLGQASRWPAVVLGHSTYLVWREILRPWLDEKDEPLWLGLLALSPLIGVGSLIVTPDVPFVFFWSLSVLCARRALDSASLAWYAALGAALGLGFCSKYPIVLFVPACLGWLAFSGSWRRARPAGVAATFAAGLVFCFPVLWWNFRHDWASFRFQLDHGFGGDPFKPSWPLEYVAGQIGLIFPPLSWFALRGRAPEGVRWLRWFAWTPLAFFLFSSFRARVEANWPIAAYPAALSLAFLAMRDARGRFGGIFWAKASIATWAAALAMVLSQIARPWMPIDPRKLKTSELSKFDALVPEAERLPNLYASNYQMAAALSFRARKLVPKLAGMNRRDFFDFLYLSQPIEDRFFLAAEKGERPPERYEAVSARDVTPDLQILEVVRRAENPGR